MVSFLKIIHEVIAAAAIAVANNNMKDIDNPNASNRSSVGGIIVSIVNISVNIAAEKIPNPAPSMDPNITKDKDSERNIPKSCLGDIPNTFKVTTSRSFS